MTEPGGYSKGNDEGDNETVLKKLLGRSILVVPRTLTSPRVIAAVGIVLDPAGTGDIFERGPMPYIRSLKKDATSGLMLSSDGGGTANIE